jgi:hypothetical protein
MAREYRDEPDMTDDPSERLGLHAQETSPNQQLSRWIGLRFTQCKSPSWESWGFALRADVIMRRSDAWHFTQRQNNANSPITDLLSCRLIQPRPTGKFPC